MTTRDRPEAARSARPCPFCHPRDHEIVEATEHVLVLLDNYPVNQGHTLIVPRRHVGSFFDVTAEERAEMFAVMERAKHGLDVLHAPQGYSIGINDGPAAGQSIAHCHVHLIPRYAGDVDNPRGGVRWVVPERARYW